VVRFSGDDDADARPVLRDVLELRQSVDKRCLRSGDLIGSLPEARRDGVLKVRCARTFTQPKPRGLHLNQHHDRREDPEPVDAPQVLLAVDDLRMSNHVTAQRPELTANIGLRELPEVVSVRLAEHVEPSVVQRSGADGRKNEPRLRGKQSTVRHPQEGCRHQRVECEPFVPRRRGALLQRRLVGRTEPVERRRELLGPHLDDLTWPCLEDRLEPFLRQPVRVVPAPVLIGSDLQEHRRAHHLPERSAEESVPCIWVGQNLEARNRVHPLNQQRVGTSDFLEHRLLQRELLVRQARHQPQDEVLVLGSRVTFVDVVVAVEDVDQVGVRHLVTAVLVAPKNRLTGGERDCPGRSSREHRVSAVDELGRRGQGGEFRQQTAGTVPAHYLAELAEADAAPFAHVPRWAELSDSVPKGRRRLAGLRRDSTVHCLDRP